MNQHAPHPMIALAPVINGEWFDGLLANACVFDCTAKPSADASRSSSRARSPWRVHCFTVIPRMGSHYDVRLTDVTTRL